MHLMDLGCQFVQDVMNRHLVSVGPSSLRSKVTELACKHTDIRWFNFLVQNKENAVTAPLLLNRMSHLTQRDDIWCPEELYTVLQSQASSRPDLVPNWNQLLISKLNFHSRLL